ncbi:Iron siderophore receptor protein [Hyphomicrobium sulfonivorans]|uniref:Iron siderophore receptor protein n=1 Tax=Hyphomicrobium sulfonivorans TaxID=121290 RepID=A0A109BBZ1_HYPSL|nr:TonB-dependent receptor [Hyphomicrobium sulfonivorans]KWT65814.1 Iron siderophore receptor protein [Hyphomicrobium sulfonivorans]
MPAYRQPICHARYSISSQRWKAALLATTAFCGFAIVIPAPLLAQSTAQSNAGQYSFNIAPQSLSSAMIAFQSITGMSVLADSSVPQNVKSPGVSGSRTAESALAQMLSGTGLSYSISANTARIINPATDSSAATVDGAIALDTIDVSGGGSSARSEAAEAPYVSPGSTAYVSAEQINRVAPVSPGDMFREVPGVSIANSRAGNKIDVNIRGMQGMSRVNTMVDGAMQQSSAYKGYDGHDSRAYVDPEMIADIMIDKGPSSGPHGAGAIGGSVNMRTLNAGDIVKDGQSYGIRLRGSGGGNMIEERSTTRTLSTIGRKNFDVGANKSGSVAAATIQDRYEAVIAASYRHQGNYFAGTNGPRSITYMCCGTRLRPTTIPLSVYTPGSQVFNTFQDTSSLLGKLKLKFDDNQSFEVGVNHYESTYGEVNPNAIAFINRPQKYAASHVQADTYTARYAWTPGSNDLVDLRANLWASDVASVLNSVGVDVDSFTWGGELYNTSRFALLKGLAITYGGQTFTEDASAHNNTTSVVNDESNLSGVRTMHSLFSNAKLDVTDWLTLHGGVRYDRYSAEEGGANPSARKSDSRINPTAAITVTPIKGVQLFTQYAEGWKPPSIRELYVRNNGIQPNPNLRPETAQNWEYGVNLSRDGLLQDDDRLRVKFAYFDNSYQDYIIRSSVRGIYRYDNIPEATFKGIEVSGSYDIGWFFTSGSYNYYTEVEYCFTASAACAAVTGTTDYNSSYVPPKYTGSVTAGTRLFDEKLTLGVRMNVAGARAVPRAAGAQVTLPSEWLPFTTFDVFGGYVLNENAKFDFSVENLKDRYYVDPLSIGLAAPGRTGRATVTVQF